MFNKCFLFVFLVFLMSPIYAEKTYYVGTGVTLGYYDQYISLTLDSYHLISSKYDMDDRALLKIGMGFNKNLNTVIQDIDGSFILGIGFISMIPLYKPPLKQFGTGFSLDYQFFNLTTHEVGATLYFLLDSYLLGIGGGIVINDELDVLPLGRISIALVF